MDLLSQILSALKSAFLYLTKAVEYLFSALQLALCGLLEKLAEVIQCQSCVSRQVSVSFTVGPVLQKPNITFDP